VDHEAKGGFPERSHIAHSRLAHDFSGLTAQRKIRLRIARVRSQLFSRMSASSEGAVKGGRVPCSLCRGPNRALTADHDFLSYIFSKFVFLTDMMAHALIACVERSVCHWLSAFPHRRCRWMAHSVIECSISASDPILTALWPLKLRGNPPRDGQRLAWTRAMR